MAGDFFALVDKHFRFLTERGMLVTRTDYNPKFFGNAFVEYQGLDCSVRVVRDRGQILVDVGAPRNDAGGPGAYRWIGIASAVSYVEAAERRPVVDFSASEAAQIEQAASFVRGNLDALCLAISQGGWSHFEAEVRRYFKDPRYTVS